MELKISRKLNVVFPVDKEDGTQVHVHSTPISQQIFDQYFDVISITYNQAIVKYGNSAPRVCHKILKQVSEKEGRWNDVRVGLMAEIRRLTNVIVPGERGWEWLMLEDAINAGHIESGDVDTIEGMLTFFTVLSWMLNSRLSKEMTEILGVSWGGQSTSLDCMEYLNSLKTSTPTERSSEKADSSVKPSIGSPAPAGKPSSVITLTSHGNPLQNSVAASS